MKHLPQAEEAPNIIKGLIPNELKDGIKIAEWNYGHLKYKAGNDYLEWTTIYVEPTFREMGFGTDMMRWIENEAKSLGKKYILVKAFTDGKSDILGRFLTKLEYKLTSEFLWKKEV